MDEDSGNVKINVVCSENTKKLIDLRFKALESFDLVINCGKPVEIAELNRSLREVRMLINDLTLHSWEGETSRIFYDAYYFQVVLVNTSGPASAADDKVIQDKFTHLVESFDSNLFDSPRFHINFDVNSFNFLLTLN